ncbi:hypothetical protein NQ317_014531 [Molorchus minor]|uniref:Uncharacterized protein n=1 Tax=Molorchus minor TaxID=1323400 RepID=A0ABQ9JCM7_9CUCU|nr:hypothetical protein NQ317_014531 [Molorchus minor]
MFYILSIIERITLPNLKTFICFYYAVMHVLCACWSNLDVRTLIGGVQANPHTKNLTEHDIEHSIKTWLS